MREYERISAIDNFFGTLRQIDVAGADGVDGDSLVECSSKSTDNRPSESASKTKKRLFASSSTNFDGDPSVGVGGANYQIDATFRLVKGDSGEMLHRRDVAAMRRNISFSREDLSDEAIDDVGVIFVFERFNGKFREFSSANDLVVNGHHTKVGPSCFQI